MVGVSTVVCFDDFAAEEGVSGVVGCAAARLAFFMACRAAISAALGLTKTFLPFSKFGL